MYKWKKINSFYLLDSLPQQCESYEILNEASRNRNNDFLSLADSVLAGIKVDNEFNGNVWYRMMQPAGTKIPEGVVPSLKCGTSATGWMNGQHPTAIGEEVERKICFNWSGLINVSNCLDSKHIKVTNCGAYYVYKLPKPDYYSMGYCAE